MNTPKHRQHRNKSIDVNRGRCYEGKQREVMRVKNRGFRKT